MCYNMIIMNQFAKIIGQRTAVSRLENSVKSYKQGGILMSPLLCGLRGQGKTKVAITYANSLVEKGATLYSFSSPNEFRLAGEGWDKMKAFFADPDGILFVDEIHEAFTTLKSVQLDKFRGFLMKSLDKANYGERIKIEDDLYATFDRTRKSVILATNRPDAVDKTGALQSRCDLITLDPYTNEELVEILKLMLQDQGFKRLNDDSLQIIAQTGRGTSRNLEKLTEEIIRIQAANGKTSKTIEKGEIKEAMKLLKMLPFGMSEAELLILTKCEKPSRQAHLFSALPQLEARTFKKAIGFLMHHEFIKYSGSCIEQSTKGKAYLQEIKQHGFA
jgi:Holliday junction resolvasome RuvABC ATP-dependent DNA helicase subunit